MSHPGNAAFASSSNPIKRFGEQGLTTLTYPASHGMDWWDSTKSGGERTGQIVYVGKANAAVGFATLPATLQAKEMAAHVGAESNEPLTTDMCTLCYHNVQFAPGTKLSVYVRGIYLIHHNKRPATAMPCAGCCCRR